MNDAENLQILMQSQTTTTALKLGIIAGGDRSARASDGSLYINHGFGRLLEALRQQIPATRLCIPVLPELLKSLTHRLNYPAEAVVPMPPLATTISSQCYRWSTKRVIRDFAKTCDILLVRMPFQLPDCVVALDVPKVVHVVGNPLAVVRASSDYRGFIGFLARRFGEHMERVCKRLAREPETRMITHGDEMWRLLGCQQGRVVVSTCLLQEEIVPRQDLTLHMPPRLLFVGYLRPEKGVAALLDAFAHLRRGREAKLTLVGGVDRQTNAGRLIKQQIESHPFAVDIETTGMVEFGPNLFELYRQHDVCILPSLSEGTPRTLVEARAFGCPVVATRVGGIPTSVGDGVDGLLVAPGQPLELSQAILRLLDDDALRRRLIHAGRTRFGNHTVDKFAAQIVAELQAVAKS